MRLVLIGPPGGGKGTQGARLSQHFNVRHVATGDVLRAEVAAGTPLGREVEGLLRRGELVPDGVVTEAVTGVFLATSKDGGYILDGYPRNVRQARTLEGLGSDRRPVAPQSVVYLDVPTPELERRLLERAEEQGRSDDTPDVIARRLQVFEDETRPLVAFYERRGLLVRIDGSGDMEAITADVIQRLVRR